MRPPRGAPGGRPPQRRPAAPRVRSPWPAPSPSSASARARRPCAGSRPAACRWTARSCASRPAASTRARRRGERRRPARRRRDRARRARPPQAGRATSRRAATRAAGPPSTTCSATSGRWVFPVGRLDRDSSGLLVLTNDHRLGQRLTDPERTCRSATTRASRGVPTPRRSARCAKASRSATARVTRPAEVRALGTARGGSSWLEIVLTEGKNRQVRRMCAAWATTCEELVRVADRRASSSATSRPASGGRSPPAEVARLAARA